MALKTAPAPTRRRTRKQVRPLWLWLASAAISLCFTAITVHTWIDAADHSTPITSRGVTVPNAAAANRVIAKRFAARRPVYLIPTGVLLHSIEFVNSNNVKVTGHIWQRIPPSLPDEVARGVMLPEADDTHPLKPAFDFTEGADHIIGWSFTATLRQQFDYRDYPLDHQDVWLRMRPDDLAHPVQLIPDFKAYPPWNPTAMHGLDPGLLFGEWQPHYTTFSLEHLEYGLSDQLAMQADELYFNVGVSRGLLGPTIGRIVPVVLLAILMFLSLFVITTDPDRRLVSGFTAFAIIGFAVTTVLVVAVNDNGARTETGSAGIAYIEFWYFTLYLMTLLVAVNATLLVAGGLRGLIAWRENLLPKLLFWPLFTGVMLAATIGCLGI
ncbi:hypothetical protein [Nocardia arthritidis]|uniref:Neurotransmitter-gated ion-channel ligand-binding domain-containing protein n=1 Tax=Nocardia arthritidis TaxID=228602 RepID=A0A6G9YH84_9NOCA|nr:hypothetical protein [Nocardia arthritidis]QIS12551.1 hypothetical protein F5544_23460 [Nocardia arthritidis]